MSKTCRHCQGKGWVIRQVGEKPKPAYWFNRIPGAPKPIPCEKCDTLEPDA